MKTVATEAVSPMSVISTIADVVKGVSHARSYYKDRSLTDIAQVTRVEPITVITKDLMSVEYLPDVLNTVVNVFAGYYLQAVSLLANIDNVKVLRVLDKLNPDRSVETALLTVESHKFQMQEAYKYRLPRLSLEESMEVKLDRNVFSKAVIDEAANLAVGKLINVTIRVSGTARDAEGNIITDNKGKAVEDTRSVTVPVSIRLAPALLPVDSVVHLLTLKKDDISFSERWHQWRAGRISFIKDLIFCQDLLNAHRKALMQDDSGVYQEIVRRNAQAKRLGLLTANPSLASASSIFVISEEAAKRIEYELGGSLDNPRIRDKAFENTFSMILVVVDRAMEFVTFYYRNVGASAEVSVKSLKSLNKRNGVDIADVMKALLQNNAPTF